MGGIAPFAWPVVCAFSVWVFEAFISLGGEGQGVAIAGLLAFVGIPLTLWWNGRQQRLLISHQHFLSQIEADRHYDLLWHQINIERARVSIGYREPLRAIYHWVNGIQSVANLYKVEFVLPYDRDIKIDNRIDYLQGILKKSKEDKREILDKLPVIVNEKFNSLKNSITIEPFILSLYFGDEDEVRELIRSKISSDFSAFDEYIDDIQRKVADLIGEIISLDSQSKVLDSSNS